MSTNQLTRSLKEYFSFDSFRPGQEEIIQSILSGTDTMAIMPTGGGKSLCYQLPAVVLDKVTIVVSPLIALMKDQVDALNARGIKSRYVNSSLSSSEISTIYSQLSNGEVRILYIAPERFSSESFMNLFQRLDIDFIAVDEAHCISQWGHDFRPEYAQLASFIAQHPKRPKLAAFTATATPEVTEDITKRLKLRRPAVFVRGFDRPNLKFFIQANMKVRDRHNEVVRLCRSMEGSGIVYCLTVKETEEIATKLCSQDIKAQAYHAQLPAKEKNKIQDDFMENEYQVIVATVAFGMGVDKADIRYVIHSGMPPSLERYYQEAGRAGRDGETAYCILLHNGRDAGTHHFFFSNAKDIMLKQGKSYEEVNRLITGKYRMLDKIKQYVDTQDCRRRFILDYFEDPQVKDLEANCKGCDHCLDYKWTSAVKTKKQKSVPTNRSELSDTVLETVKLYLVGKSPSDIASIRSLGVRTVWNHLIDWYGAGGNFPYDTFLSVRQESLIKTAIEKVGSSEKLRPIKDKVPDSITYEQIKLVLARQRREQL